MTGSPKQACWVLAACGGLIFVGLRVHTTPAPAAELSQRIIDGADRVLGVQRTSRAAVWSYLRAVSLDPFAAAPRARLAELLWNNSNAALGRGRDPRRRLLLKTVSLLRAQNVAWKTPGGAIVNAGLAEVELSRLEQDPRQQWRWLDMAAEDAGLFAEEVAGLPSGTRELGRLFYLRGRIALRRYELTGQAGDLKEISRHFWSAAALAPDSWQHRFYLAYCLQMTGRGELARRVAGRWLKVCPACPDSSAGPDRVYLRLIREISGGSAAHAPI